MATQLNSGNVTTFSIKINGSEIPSITNILSVTVNKKVNEIPSAIITILDGEASTGKFEASSSATFIPGNKVTIACGYDSKNETVFEGIITSQTIRIDNTVGSALEITCMDEAIKMTVGKKSNTFINKKDSEIITEIVSKQVRLSSNATPTATASPVQVQYNTTDWDYIKGKAASNGMLINIENGMIKVAPPDANTSSVLSVSYGEGLMEFNATLNAISQVNTAKASSWDYKNQAILSEKATNSIAGPGNLSSKKLSEVIGLSEYELQTTAPLTSNDLMNWAKATLVKSAFSKITGEASFQGTSIVNPGVFITLEGLGDRFNGDHFVSGVTHTISDGNWKTEVAIGLVPNWDATLFTHQNTFTSAGESNMKGLFNGTVKQIDNDPDTEYRILVSVPLLDPSGEGIWARFASFYATNDAGIFFLPEVGDEVVVGFLNDNPCFPILLGSMYNNTSLKPNAKTNSKTIVSKSKMAIEFDDENVVWTLTTPNKNTILVSDKDKQITVKDEHQNSIEMSSNGITIKSTKDLMFEASEKVILKGNTGITIESSGGDVATTGLNIKETAQMQFSAKGNLTSEVQGGTELTLKAAMIMIN